ncbi:MAG: Mur ligase family protein [Paludibacter sp.]|nr:Mur ligase family protein [Paludibacter sp.]
MQRVHFISIGGVAMHNLAIAISKKNNFQVTGSDDEIADPILIRLKENNLLPDKMGWFTEKISKNLSGVIIGQLTKSDNPELVRAKELGLKIYSFPEFIYQQTRSKTRIVISGSHGKTTIIAMILFVLKKLRMDADYMINNQIEGYENQVKLTYDSRIAVLEGDVSQTSPIDIRPKFHLYKPHIAVLTGIEMVSEEKSSTVENYVEPFQKFTDLMEIQGRLIYFDGDEKLNAICHTLRRDIVSFPYNIHENVIQDGVTYLVTKKANIPLKITGDYNLQNLNAARLTCRQIGISDDQFYSIITDFQGISKTN